MCTYFSYFPTEGTSFFARTLTEKELKVWWRGWKGEPPTFEDVILTTIKFCGGYPRKFSGEVATDGYYWRALKTTWNFLWSVVDKHPHPEIFRKETEGGWYLCVRERSSSSSSTSTTTSEGEDDYTVVCRCFTTFKVSLYHNVGWWTRRKLTEGKRKYELWSEVKECVSLKKYRKLRKRYHLITEETWRSRKSE